MDSIMLPKYEICARSVNNKPTTSVKGTDSCQENTNNKTHSKKNIWPVNMAEQQSLSTDMGLTMEVSQCPAL